MYVVLSLALCPLRASALGSRINNTAQFPLTLAHGFQDVPGGSIVKPCPESHHSDILAIERIFNKPQVPYLQVPVLRSGGLIVSDD